MSSATRFRRWEQDGETLVDWDTAPARGWDYRTPAQCQITEDRRAFAQSMRAVGHTLQDIGDALGVSRERARQLIVGNNPQSRAPTSRVVGRGHADPLRAVAMARAGHGVARIARTLGCSDEAVHKVFRALGEPLGRGRQRAASAAQWLQATKDLAAELGRTPTAREIGERKSNTKHLERAGPQPPALAPAPDQTEARRLLRAAKAASGVSGRAFAARLVLHPNERSVRRWLAGQTPIPASVVAQIRAQVDVETKALVPVCHNVLPCEP